MIQRCQRSISIPAILVAGFLAIQIAIPMVALAFPRPARFSWQMYAGVKTTATFIAVEDDGSEWEIDLADYMGNPRLDVDVTETLPAFVCQTTSAVVLVRAEDQLSDDVTVFPCK